MLRSCVLTLFCCSICCENDKYTYIMSQDNCWKVFSPGRRPVSDLWTTSIFSVPCEQWFLLLRTLRYELERNVRSVAFGVGEETTARKVYSAKTVPTSAIPTSVDFYCNLLPRSPGHYYKLLPTST